MIKPTPPVSNTERQRAFRARNPGYYGRLHRKRRAQIKAARDAYLAAQSQTETPPAPLLLPAPEQPILISLPVTPEAEPVILDTEPLTDPAAPLHRHVPQG